jgi:CRISPR-associated endonuclease Cas2
MAVNKDEVKSFVKKMMQVQKAGIEHSRPLSSDGHDQPETEDLETRIEKITGFVKRSNFKPSHMLYFVMYDIENDKVRRYIAKFLEDKGLTRVQKSIFLANTERAVYKEIHQVLKEVQEVYDNQDSIIMVPVSVDEVRAMKLIGSNVDFDIIMGNRNTLFF